MANVVRHLSADGFTPITRVAWPLLASDIIEVDSDRLKFAVENVADRVLGDTPYSAAFLVMEQVGTGDGFQFLYTLDDPNGTVSKPWGAGLDSGSVPNGSPVVTLSGPGASGSWSSTGVKGVVVVARRGSDATTPSVEQTFNITATTQKATPVWAQTPGADSYDVYFTDTPGDYAAAKFVHVAGGGAVTTVDLDGTGASQAPPDENTTGGAGPDYGTPPDIGDFAQDDLTIGTLAIGQQFFYYAALKIPPGTTSAGNTRAARVRVKEVV